MVKLGKKEKLVCPGKRIGRLESFCKHSSLMKALGKLDKRAPKV